MPKRNIRKSADAVVATTDAAGAVHELTNIEVHEVSLVDKPANERAFLLKKSKKAKKGETPEVVGPESVPAEEIDLALAQKAADELKAKDLADKATTESAKAAADVKALDAADKTTKAETPVVVVADPTVELAALVEATAKADVTIETDAGDVTVTVGEAPEKKSAVPQLVIDKIKAAMLAGIDAIGARLAKFRSDVEAGSPGPYSSWGQPDGLWDHTYYLQSMIDALYNIGGPAWEIENAADSAVAKAHKTINSTRVAKLAAIHKGLTYCMKDYSGLMKELSAETPDETDEADGADATAKAATPAAPAAPVVDPAVEELRKMVQQLQSATEKQSAAVVAANETIAKQAAEIAKARNTVAGSNSLTVETVEKDANGVPDRGTVIWPADLAPANGAPKRVRF